MLNKMFPIFSFLLTNWNAISLWKVNRSHHCHPLNIKMSFFCGQDGAGIVWDASHLVRLRLLKVSFEEFWERWENIFIWSTSLRPNILRMLGRAQFPFKHLNQGTAGLSFGFLHPNGVHGRSKILHYQLSSPDWWCLEFSCAWGEQSKLMFITNN